VENSKLALAGGGVFDPVQIFTGKGRKKRGPFDSVRAAGCQLSRRYFLWQTMSMGP
jgi:hypothetical protein